jgi:predicted small secreted protein
MKKLIVLMILLMAAAFYLAGCQMMEGLGRDVQWTGDSLQKTAD